MEVTRKNFKETLPLVAESIDKADFLVIDTEFTGLINGRDVSPFDLPEDYYITVLNASCDFLLIQFGLCAFYWDEKENQYVNDAYNFYLFPRGKPGPERTFLCQGSSLDFLASQGFDFNKLIRDGISYMSEPIETQLRENLAERQKLYNNESHITIPEEHQQYIDDICKRVRQFLDEKKSDEMEIDRCNAFIRRLLFQELGTKFKKEVFLETKVLENKNRVLKVTRISSETDRKNRDNLKVEKEWEEFEDAVGFSKVARMISQSEKLVIGHNMLLDVLHTLNHFFQPLTDDYRSFKEFAHCMFPKLLDTKYMSSLPPFKEKVNSSVLQHLLASLSEPPFSLPKTVSKQGRGYTQSDDKAHEAGYDAFITGLCFLSMNAHLSRMRGEATGRADAQSAALKPFLNKLFLAKTAHQDSPYIHLTGDDPSPSRDHVFHLTFPREWSRNDINQLFSPFGQIYVQFLDDTTALVGLSRREQARDVRRTLANHARIELVPYAMYRSGAKFTTRKPEDYRRDYSTVKSAHSDLTPKSSQAKPSTTKLPEKVERPRANSASAATESARLPRKRTSSGVFQVEEPPSKKSEVTRTEIETPRKKLPNGRRKTSESEKETETREAKGEKEKRGVIEKFDKDAKSKCVNAFKESDSWD